jgi:hypothetical protein
MKDLGEASYVLGIEIHRNRAQRVLGLSQKAYIAKILMRYNMDKSRISPAPIQKGDMFNEDQCSKNDFERSKMENVPYASTVGFLMYAQVWIPMRPNLTFATEVFSRYQKNPSWAHWIGVKKSMRYCQGTKDYMLTYRRTNDLVVECYTYADFASDEDDRKSTSGYVYMLAGGAISWKSHKLGVTLHLQCK